MEMDMVHSETNVEGTEEESDVQLPSPCYSDGGVIFKDPETLPRIGDSYQAQIPPLIMDCVQLTNSLLLSLPIPIMWAPVDFDNSKKEGAEVLFNQAEAPNINGAPVEIINSKGIQITSNDGYANIMVKPLTTALNDGKGISNLHLGGAKVDVDIMLPQNKNTQLEHRGTGYYPFPGSLGESWSDFESDSFILGLYIFGKNLLLVNKFVESKEMGDVLSFYYGDFYRSDGYYRWSQSRKIRSRRSTHGQRIFSGGKLHELLSRLVRDVSEKCRTELMEVSKTFEEGKISLEEYVFTLKNAVGIGKLIEAIGIGKGKQDLTATAVEPIKTSHVFPVRPEIPFGKACSSLSCQDIIKFLTGDFRLSKARSNDLFWEAVWPRLLARGWHSEQPKDHGVDSLKHHLVFLIPGIKKFSRRKLVKGEHYFDSVSDVLSKVASNPGLLELETEAAEVSRNREEQWRDPQIEQNPDDSWNLQRHLKPRKSKCIQDVMKFTIVDTSLCGGEEGFNIRAVRRLAIATENGFCPSTLINETEHDMTQNLEDEEEDVDASNPLEAVTDRGASNDSSECITSILNNGNPTTSDSTILPVENHEGQSACLYNGDQSGKSKKCELIQRLKCSHLSNTASGHESSHRIENMSSDSKLNEENLHYRSNSRHSHSHEPMAHHVGPSHHLPSASSSAKGSPEGRNEGYFENSQDSEMSIYKHQLQAIDDLNIADHAPPDSGTDESLFENKSSFGSERSQHPEPLHLSDEGASIQQQPVVNGRRQSTRNRPLTTKALEAIECGFFKTKRKRKLMEAIPKNNSSSKSFRMGRGNSDVHSTFNNASGNSIANSRIDDAGLDEIFRNNTRMVDGSQV